jgi:hypothetical protein
LSNNSKS